jgi:serine/threonine-protein kinase
LNDSHIAAIYGLEESPASDSQPIGVNALVMELVEGPTLADRIARGPMSLKEALPIARQLVAALDYAHERGVLHRDLKPANLKVTSDGQLKVLDFGLAKALGVVGGRGDSHLREVKRTNATPWTTHASSILGTPAYMAPEQVRGRPVDKRADIWAFGCVLYEMLSGVPAFRRDTVTGTLAAVVEDAPDWSRLPPSLPPPVFQLLVYCLERDPKARLRDIADARRFLVPAPAEASPSASPGRGAGWLALGIGAAAAAGVLGGALYAPRSSTPGPALVRRVTVPLPVVLPASTSGGGPALAISPDGSAVAFTARAIGQNQLYVHRLVDGTTVSVRGPVNPNSPSFSPDGTWVAFGAIGGGFWRAATAGGPAEPFCAPSIGGGVRGTTWDAAGRAFFGTALGLFEAPAVGQPCRLTLETDGRREARFLWPQILPGGRGTLVTIAGISDDADSASIVVVPAGTSERRVVVRDARAGRLAKSGHLLFARGHQILAAPFDLDRLTVSAEPVVVLDGVALGQFGGPLADVSDSGDLVYVPGQALGNRLVWVTREGLRSDSGAPRRSYVSPPRLSPDGRRAAVSIGTADHFLWSYSLETGSLAPLTTEDSHVAVWSPDSRRVAYPHRDGIAIKDLDSTGEVETLLQARRGGVPSTWSPDRKTLVGSRNEPDGSTELFALALEGGSATTLLRGRHPFLGAEFSPDGRWLAYASSESGQLEVFVTDFPAARIKVRASTDGGFAPAWAPNGRELFYVNGTSMMAAAVRPGPTIGFDKAIRLFDDFDLAVGNVTTYSVAPDGRFLLVEEGQSDVRQRRQLTLILNWFEELNRLAPRR